MQISFVKAAKDFFETGEFGRKVEISEFRALSTEEREELRGLLIEEGYDVLPLGVVES